LYPAISKFDETEPTFVKTVHLVNLDNDVTSLINKEFALWFGGVPEMGVTTECRHTILQNSEARDLSRGAAENENLGASSENNILLVWRSKKKPYIPEKFTYFWRCESPFSPHFKCEFEKK